jgi:hypothetical protein
MRRIFDYSMIEGYWTSRAAGMREIMEETGYKIGELSEIATFFSSPAFLQTNSSIMLRWKTPTGWEMVAVTLTRTSKLQDKLLAQHRQVDTANREWSLQRQASSWLKPFAD